MKHILNKNGQMDRIRMRQNKNYGRIFEDKESAEGNRDDILLFM